MENYTAIQCDLQSGLCVKLLHCRGNAKGVPAGSAEWERAWREAELQSIVEISRDGQVIFVLRPDGRTEASAGFGVDEAAAAFWEAMRMAAPKLFESQHRHG